MLFFPDFQGFCVLINELFKKIKKISKKVLTKET